MDFFIHRGRIVGTFIGNLLFLWLNFHLSSCTETDIQCLRNIKNTLEDSNNRLNSTWIFDNKTNIEGSICTFSGVECWHPNENRILRIRLSGNGLKGQFPRGIQNCSNLNELDLSGNDLSGPIPSDISLLLEFVTTLDLSSNKFSGGIPRDLAKCNYLNVLKLDDNQLSGVIPPELGLLGRIKTFSVTNNLLSGPVPRFINATIPAGSYKNNPSLCGDPLPPCKNSKNPQTVVIVGSAAACAIVASLGLAIGMTFLVRRLSKKKNKKDEDDPEGNKWAKKLKGDKGIKVSLFETAVAKIRLRDLMRATNDFSSANIIGTGRTGTIYNGVLDDGTLLTIKRLQESQYSEKGFASEMATLGSVKHVNLVPLLGFCLAKKERLLVYKYMPNGTLHDQLHLPNESEKVMQWPTRLKIGIGAARGLAWLHHNCNPRIIHRNISSKCIFLDTDFDPKISDFGLARFMSQVDTHLSTFVNGEFGDLGYVTPEYTRTLVATPKGDVYSFGVVLLELVTGETPTRVLKPSENFEGNLVDWITKLNADSKLQEAVDKSLAGNGVDDELRQFLKVASICVTENPKERPTMFEVHQLLRAIGERYKFKDADDTMMPSDTSYDGLVELIVVADNGGTLNL